MVNRNKRWSFVYARALSDARSSHRSRPAVEASVWHWCILSTACSSGCIYCLVLLSSQGYGSNLFLIACVNYKNESYSIRFLSFPNLWLIRSQARNHPATPSGPFTFYTIAAILGPIIVPWTFTVMKPTNDRLSELAVAAAEKSTAEKVKEEEVTQLITKWKWLNAVRAVSVFSGLLCGAYAMVTWPGISVWGA